MVNKRRKPGELIHIADVLSRIVKNIRPEADTDLSRIRDVWNRVVDSAIADNTRPEALKDDILLIVAASSTLVHRLRFLTPGIIEQINRVMGQRRINQIKYKIGKV